MRIAIAAAAVGVAGVLWAGVAAQQELLPKPGPGSGVVQVTGTVHVLNTPDVRVSNTPDVRVSNTPDVRITQLPPVAIAPAPFVRKNRQYTITWTDGGTERITVLETGQDGWVEVEGTRARWVNLRAAKSIEER